MLLLIAALTLPGCATLSKNTAKPEPPASYVTPVSAQSGDAHVCPIDPHRAMTAFHVAYQRNPFTGEITPRPMVFADADGKPVTVLAELYDTRRDLAIVATYGGAFPGWYTVSNDIPKVGDKIWLQGYDLPSGMTTKRFEASVLSSNVAGNIRFRGNAEAGSSGSCIANEENELVGINTSLYIYRKPNSLAEPILIGSGLIVAGPWFSIPSNFSVVTDEEEPEDCYTTKYGEVCNVPAYE
jgi:hypothetical protein